jgi:hypothetical protein
MRQSLAIAFSTMVTMSTYAQTTIESPQGTVQVTISANADGRLVYAVQFAGKQVLAPSPIGVKVDETDFGTGVEIGAAKEEGFESKFPWRGNHAEVDVAGKFAAILIQQKGGAAWTLEVKCFDNGVAYRCVIPGEGTRKVAGEAAAWEFPAGTFAWCNPNTATYEGVYERFAVNEIPADKFKNGIGMPTTLELPGGGFAVLTEADVMGYSGMTLASVKDKNVLEAAFRDDAKGWSMSGEIKTPWRVLMLSADLNGLVHNDIVPALCPPPDGKLFPEGIRTEWLKPGRCLWQWWAYDDAGTHWSKQKWFVDQAAELKCQYYLVDEGWEHTRQEWASEGKDVWTRMKELCDYAAGKGVGIWVWKGWTFDEKRQWPGLETPQKREDFFRHCAEAGVKGTKIDFMDSESHDRLAFYEDCLRVGAKYKVMVNFHGANKPTGEARTWPNEMTREGVRGLEYNKWDALPPVHYATLPFTRYLAGHGDFTPTTFQPERIKGTTFAQQLAGAVVFNSPILCWADKPDLYLASPAVEFMRNIPPVWDETIVLPGSVIGGLAAFARRSGDDWYVGVINGGKAREITIDFAFLGSGDRMADFFTDVPAEATKLDVQKNVKIKASTKQVVKLNDGGGFVAWIRK